MHRAARVRFGGPRVRARGARVGLNFTGPVRGGGECRQRMEPDVFTVALCTAFARKGGLGIQPDSNRPTRWPHLRGGGVRRLRDAATRVGVRYDLNSALGLADDTALGRFAGESVSAIARKRPGSSRRSSSHLMPRDSATGGQSAGNCGRRMRRSQCPLRSPRRDVVPKPFPRLSRPR